MGLCEGFPSSIMPNHMGKADYHGVSVNQAARFMDAAAHGGQVACEEDLVLRVFGSWEALVRAAACTASPVACPGDALLEVPEGGECDTLSSLGLVRGGTSHSFTAAEDVDAAGPSGSGGLAVSGDPITGQRSSAARSSDQNPSTTPAVPAGPAASRDGGAWTLPQQSLVEAAFVEITANHLGRFRCVGFPPAPPPLFFLV